MTALATTDPCANDAEVLDTLFGALSSRKFVFGRLMGLVDDLGWITPKAAAGRPTSAEYADAGSTEDQDVSGAAETKMGRRGPCRRCRCLPWTATATPCSQPNLNAHLVAPHAALPPRSTLPLFLEHSDPRSMSMLAMRRVECRASQNQLHGKQSSPWATARTGGFAVRWVMVDDRPLEEAVVCAVMGLLFIGVKT